jgi:hypothetical protein
MLICLDGFNDEFSVYVHWLEYIQLTLPKRENRTQQ